MAISESESSHQQESTQPEQFGAGQFSIPLSEEMHRVVEQAQEMEGGKAAAKSAESVARSEGLSSAELLQVIVRVQPDLAGGRLEKAIYEIDLEMGPHDRILNWIERIAGLYDPSKLTELDTRLAVLGLSHLDPELRSVLNAHDIIELIKKELPFEFESVLDGGTPTEVLSADDPSVLHLDTAADRDHLGRDGFVEALAIWLNRIWHKSNPKGKEGKQNSFMVHLHGAWGSGKTTLLNILRSKLAGRIPPVDRRWVVVEFNAWENSHIDPPWWPLLNQVYKDARSQLKHTHSRWKAFTIWLYDRTWKLLSGNKTVGLSFLVLLLLTVIAFIYWEKSNVIIGDIAKTATSLGTVLTGTLYLFRSMFWGSAESADHYIRLTEDPLRRIKNYFRKLIERIDRPVMVFIDDLDRCQASYVVALLEQIQTLFNDSRVFYLLAADRRWLYGSFEEQYGDFKKHIDEPGKRLGYLFLDKIFQLSVSVPQVSRQSQEAYLDYLYLGENRYTSEEIRTMREDAKKEFRQTATESELISKAGESTGEAMKDQIRREEAVRASAGKEIETSTEFFLKDFAHLLEPNPRSIKRLVNNYGIYRAIVILSDLELINSLDKRKKFAIWNIMNMRWPLLVEYMEENPLELDAVLAGDEEGIGDEKIRDLAGDPEVVKLLRDNEMGVTLEAGYVKRILNLENRSLY